MLCTFQVSQYAFAMCSYPERKSEPNEMLQLDGFTVDYSEPEPNHEGGRAFFNALREGENVIFARSVEILASLLNRLCT